MKGCPGHDVLIERLFTYLDQPSANNSALCRAQVRAMGIVLDYAEESDGERADLTARAVAALHRIAAMDLAPDVTVAVEAIQMLLEYDRPENLPAGQP